MERCVFRDSYIREPTSCAEDRRHAGAVHPNPHARWTAVDHAGGHRHLPHHRPLAVAAGDRLTPMTTAQDDQCGHDDCNTPKLISHTIPPKTRKGHTPLFSQVRTAIAEIILGAASGRLSDGSHVAVACIAS